MKSTDSVDNGLRGVLVGHGLWVEQGLGWMEGKVECIEFNDQVC